MEFNIRPDILNLVEETTPHTIIGHISKELHILLQRTEITHVQYCSIDNSKEIESI